MKNLITRAIFGAIYVAVIAGGILGGRAGSRVNRKIEAEHVNRLFEGLMVLIMLICVYNMYRFW